MISRTLAVSVLALSLAACGGSKGSKGAAGPDGPVGPGGLPVNPPVLTSITPEFASAAMSVTITGQNFSTTAANDIVFFGGVQVSVDSATATTLVLHPSSGIIDSEADVSVEVGGQTSNSIRYAVGFAGDYWYLPTEYSYTISDTIKLASGVTLVSGTGGRVYTVSAAGVVTRVVSDAAAIENIARMVVTPTGSVLAFERNRDVIWKIDTAIGTASVYFYTASGNGWRDASFDGTVLWLLQDNGTSVDQLMPNGTFNSNVFDFSSTCSDLRGIAFIGDVLWAGTGNGSLCNIDTVTTPTVVNTVALSTANNSFRGLRVEGADLLGAGVFGNANVAATINATTGVVTPVTLPLQNSSMIDASALGGGTYLIATDRGETFVTDLASRTLKSTRATQSRSLAEAGGKWYAIVGQESPAIVEVNADGSYRVVTNDKDGTSLEWDNLTIDGANVVFADRFNGLVRSAPIATGVVVTVVDATLENNGTVGSFVKDASGNYYVHGYQDVVGNISRYVNGTATPDFYTGTGIQGSGMILVGTKIYFATETGVVSATVGTTGAATDVSVNAIFNISAIAADAGGTIYALSSDDSSVYKLGADGSATFLGQASVGESMTFDSYGRILIGDTDNDFYAMLP